MHLARCARASRSIAVVGRCLSADTRYSITLSARSRIDSGNLIRWWAATTPGEDTATRTSTFASTSWAARGRQPLELAIRPTSLELKVFPFHVAQFA